MIQVLSLPRTGCIRAVVKEVTGNGLCQGEAGQGRQRNQIPSGSQHPVQGGQLLTLCVG